MHPAVRLAVPDDRARVVETVVAAFAADPVLRFCFPDDAAYRHGAPRFFGALFDKRVSLGTAWVAGDGVAAALWDPPGAGVSADLSSLPEDALARVQGYDAAIHAALPAGDFWYLGVLGTHPDAAGRGWGRAVAGPGIERARAAGLPCVLETSNPANIGFYERGGWEVVNAVESPVPTWILQRA